MAKEKLASPSPKKKKEEPGSNSVELDKEVEQWTCMGLELDQIEDLMELNKPNGLLGHFLTDLELTLVSRFVFLAKLIYQ